MIEGGYRVRVVREALPLRRIRPAGKSRPTSLVMSGLSQRKQTGPVAGVCVSTDSGIIAGGGVDMV